MFSSSLCHFTFFSPLFPPISCTINAPKKIIIIKSYVMSKGWITYWICICSYDFWRWIWSLRSCLTDRYDIYKYSCQRFHHVLYFHNECQTHCHTMKDQQNSAFIHDRRTTGSASKKDWQFFPPYVFRIHNADMFEDFQKMWKRKRYL